LRVLHLVSNHKLTGPVDPAIRLARSLNDVGVDSCVAVGRLRLGPGPIDDAVRDRGLEPVTEFCLSKHRRPFANRRDVLRLTAYLRDHPVDILHAHLDNAQRIALRARRSLPPAEHPLVVRTLYDGEIPELTRDMRRLFHSGADGVFVFAERLRAQLAERFSLDGERTVAIAGSVATDVFYPRAPSENLRRQLELPEDAVVAGIVARIQTHRRYEVLLDAFQRVTTKVPNLYLLVLGRGTKAKEIAHAGVERFGLEDRVRLPGYIGGDDYPRALACFDFKIFLVPGSDGTCRAVREAMAMGMPIIAARRGLLPAIVRDEQDGLVVVDDVERLRQAIERLATDDELRHRLGQSALERAQSEFLQERQAQRVKTAYESWLKRDKS